MLFDSRPVPILQHKTEYHYSFYLHVNNKHRNSVLHDRAHLKLHATEEKGEKQCGKAVERILK